MISLINYIGQLRLYSVIDLIILLLALNADIYTFAGVIILHLAFIAYLESSHSHPYRKKVPKIVSYVLAVIGIILYGRVEGIIYLIFSFLYVQKIRNIGFVSPFMRGLQNLFITGGIIGYSSPFTYLVGGLFFLRNLAGDIRDVEKDRKEKVETVPILLGFQGGNKYIHLIFTIFTSIVWWHMSSLSIIWLCTALVAQILVYNLTPR